MSEKRYQPQQEQPQQEQPQQILDLQNKIITLIQQIKEIDRKADEAKIPYDQREEGKKPLRQQIAQLKEKLRSLLPAEVRNTAIVPTQHSVMVKEISDLQERIASVVGQEDLPFYEALELTTPLEKELKEKKDALKKLFLEEKTSPQPEMFYGQVDASFSVMLEDGRIVRVDWQVDNGTAMITLPDAEKSVQVRIFSDFKEYQVVMLGKDQYTDTGRMIYENDIFARELEKTIAQHPELLAVAANRKGLGHVVVEGLQNCLDCGAVVPNAPSGVRCREMRVKKLTEMLMTGTSVDVAQAPQLTTAQQDTFIQDLLEREEDPEQQVKIENAVAELFSREVSHETSQANRAKIESNKRIAECYRLFNAQPLNVENFLAAYGALNEEEKESIQASVSYDIFYQQEPLLYRAPLAQKEGYLHIVKAFNMLDSVRQEIVVAIKNSRDNLSVEEQQAVEKMLTDFGFADLIPTVQEMLYVFHSKDHPVPEVDVQNMQNKIQSILTDNDLSPDTARAVFECMSNNPSVMAEKHLLGWKHQIMKSIARVELQELLLVFEQFAPNNFKTAFKNLIKDHHVISLLETQFAHYSEDKRHGKEIKANLQILKDFFGQ